MELGSPLYWMVLALAILFLLYAIQVRKKKRKDIDEFRDEMVDAFFGSVGDADFIPSLLGSLLEKGKPQSIKAFCEHMLSRGDISEKSRKILGEIVRKEDRGGVA